MKSGGDLHLTHPHLKEFLGFLDKLKAESERGAVLVSTGFLEEQLRQVLAAFLIEDKAAASLLEGSNAPLGTFSARITACFAMGLISQAEHHDLHQLRRIRNDFAHSIHVSFETPSIADRCKTLLLKVPDHNGKVPPVQQFKTAAIALIMNLGNRPYYVSQERLAGRAWPD